MILMNHKLNWLNKNHYSKRLHIHKRLEKLQYGVLALNNIFYRCNFPSEF